ncbi:MAG: hypothetical protein MAG794_01033 [Gammaproteobacteria bacterium]|nr:hypothetical protein [Gammaproteobacteria bacterium]
MAGRETVGYGLGAGGGADGCRWDSLHPYLLDYLLCFPDFNLATFYKPFHHGIEDFRDHSCRRCHASRVKGHMPLLDALRRQGPERGEILCQSHRAHDLRQFPRGLGAKQPQIQRHCRIRFEGTAYGADFQRHFQFAHQVAHIVLVPA